MNFTNISSLAAFGAIVLAGCVASESVPRGNYKGLFDCDSSLEAAQKDVSEAGDGEGRQADDTRKRDGAWSWEELALRAGQRSTEFKEGRLDALVKRLKAEQDVAWKDPEFRFTQRWSDEDSSSWSRKFDYDGDPKKWLESSRKSGDGDGWSSQYGVRLYIPNPFINRYLARRGEASVRSSEAKAELDAYGIYTEVKLLCAEYQKAKREAELYAERVAVVTRLRKVMEAGKEHRVSRSPFDVIRVETQHRKTTMRLADLERGAARLKRTIARLADVDPEGFEIATQPAALVDPATLNVDALAEIAFARRPDLARAIAERDAAEASLGAAKAAYIPWFRFVSGSYRHSKDDSSTYTRATSDHTYAESRDRADDWALELAITVPLFTWCGDSVKISRAIRDLAEERVNSLYEDVREEIRAALDAYAIAYERDDEASHAKFVADMTREIDEYAESGATIESEAGKSRQELVDYQILHNDVYGAKVEAALRLESVIGGPIPTDEAPAAEKTPAAETPAAEAPAAAETPAAN